VFDVPGVALLLPTEGPVAVAASAGEPLSGQELGQLDPGSGIPVRVGTAPGGPGEMRTIALSAAGRPVGMLVLRGVPGSGEDRALLGAFANHAALALERTQLREQAMRSELLQEVDRLRRALIGAVSHDLRTPLASMKVASSVLLDPAIVLSDADASELHGLIDVQTDRLTRLVTSLLDLTRYQAGVLEVRRTPSSVLDLVGESVALVRPTLGDRTVEVDLSDTLPPVAVDRLLIGQVLANLLDNADRFGPAGSPLIVSGEVRGGRVALSVTDRGPGVPPTERESVFEGFVRHDTGGRAGLGLTIAQTFVEAHSERIWVEDVPGGGARFVFTMPVALLPAPTTPCDGTAR
jgi:two-component system sensor histidine kinase KdpD